MRHHIGLTRMIGRMTMDWQGGRIERRTRGSGWTRRVLPPVLGMLALGWAGAGPLSGAEPGTEKLSGEGWNEGAAQVDTLSSGESRDSRTPPPVPAMNAVRVQGAPPVIDGNLNDPAWEYAPVATDFVQVEPHEGRSASERTEVRVLYDDEALYVAFRAWDSQPDSIVGQLTRRDQQSYSDRVHVMVDSYHDRRTAFHFAVNPVGVKTDLYRYNDFQEDTGWDAVWDVATRVDDQGWTAEFRVPLSQLRFSSAPVQTWGINFAREIARRNELAVWAPLSPRDQSIVSRAGELQGIRDLYTRRRIEVLPYSVARATRGPGDAANPFFSSTDVGGEVGGDVKIGITNNLTLDLTVNPDFGQVEADPGQVNLTAFETFLPERRPFFTEGASIFNFGIGVGDGDGSAESLFYSRRVGRAPQGGVDGGGWVDRPSQTRILAAGKLSGKTESGWSVGALSALTGSEEARIAHADGTRDSRTIEPLANYSLLRVQRDFRDGGSAVGLIGTGTFRDGGPSAELGLRDQAFSGGVDLRHRFRDNTLEFKAYLLGSHVSGSEFAMERTQRSPARYYQRPDAEHLTLDPTATSLFGWSANMELFKVGGGPWRYASLTQIRSPGFEVNDLGFMPGADHVNQVGFVGYRQTEPGRWLRNWGVNANAWAAWTFGWEQTGLGGNVNGQFTLNNNWNGYGGVNVNASTLNTTLLRGGPAFRTERQWNGWNGMNSDGRRDLQVSMNTNWSVRPESDSWSFHASPNVRWRPSERATVRVGPFANWRVEDRQWVDRVGTDNGPAYLFGRMDQTTFGLTTRLDLALSPTLSLQFYGQPFMSAGSFGEFKQVNDPRGASYAQRVAPVTARRDGTGFVADLNGNGAEERFRNPDFNVAQFRSNAVLRWEYRPGSTLYAVWGQARDHFSQDGEFRLGDGMGDLFSQEPENVLMLKVSYWLSP
jgi:hypothetical protein